MRRTVAVAACAALVGGGIALAVWTHAGPSRPAPARAAVAVDDEGSAREIREMRREMQDLRARVAEARTDRKASDDDAREEKGSEPERDADDAPARETRQERPDRSVEVADSVEERVKSEPLDRAWSRQTETALKDALTTPAFAGSSVVSVDCHSTVCRLDASHETGTAQAMFVRELRRAPGFEQSAGFARPVYDEHGAHTVVYLSRPGMPLLQSEN